MRLGLAGRAAIFGNGRRRYALLAISLSAILAAASGAPAADAAPVTVGSPLVGSFPPQAFDGILTIFNFDLGEVGARVTSPVNGTVISWHVTEATGGPFYLVVATEVSAGSYMATAISTGQTPVSLARQTFSTDLPIKAGQTVGINNTNSTDTIGDNTASGSEFLYLSPPLTVGASGSYVGGAPGEVGFNAVVQPLPSITHLSSHSGSRRGGKKITIDGTNFDGTTAVKFGTTKAKKFKVISDTKLTAVTPRHKAGRVHVIVFNPGKSAATNASKFRFTKPKA